MKRIIRVPVLVSVTLSVMTLHVTDMLSRSSRALAENAVSQINQGQTQSAPDQSPALDQTQPESRTDSAKADQIKGVNGASDVITNGSPTSVHNSADKRDAITNNSSPSINKSATNDENGGQNLPETALIGRIRQLISETTPTVPPTSEESISTEQPPRNYSKKFLGGWSGTVAIDQHEFGISQKRYPELVRREGGLLYQGRTGTTTVVFQRDRDGSISVNSPLVEFHPSTDDLKYLDLVNAKSNGSGAPQPLGTLPAGLRLNIMLGSNSSGNNIAGATQNSVELSKHITVVNDKEIEQQIVTSTQSVKPGNNLASFNTCESVLHFKMVSPSRMDVHLALVHYGQDGKYESKLLLHGTLTKDKK